MTSSNLGARSLVALVGIPVYVGATILGGAVFFVVNLVIVWAAAGEFVRLGRPRRDPEVVPTLVVCAASLALMASGRPGPAAGLAVLPFAVVLGMDIVAGRPRCTLLRASRASASVLYVAWLFGHVHLLRLPTPLLGRWGAEGWRLALIPFYLAWIVDTAAYAVGCRWGRRRLAPLVSPHKTWEGGAAGLAAGLLAGASLTWLVPLPTGVGLLLGGIAGTIGQGADLGESLLKREAGVKDTSCLIPGHGGVLDRFDSLLATIPCVYYALGLLGGVH